MCFFLTAFKILSLSLTFGILIMMYLGVVLFGSILFGTLCFLDLYVYLLHQIKDVLFHFFSHGFTISCSFSSSMTRMLVGVNMSQRLFSLSFFWFFLFLLSDWIFFSSLCFKSLIWFLASSTSCWFPVIFSLFHLACLFYAVEIPGKFLEHPNN